jgi:hypothetical protein
MYNVNILFILTTDLLLLTMTDKRQTRPLIRECAPEGQDSNSQTESNTWSWAPDMARHQDWLTDWLTDWLIVSCNVTFFGRNIPFVNSVKYLGEIFDKKVTWR